MGSISLLVFVFTSAFAGALAMNLNRWASAACKASARILAFAGVLVVVGVLPSLAQAQEGLPEVISPLRVESDWNAESDTDISNIEPL